MSDLSINNTFSGGLITDLGPFNLPKDSVSDALNMELITIAENQYLFQNIKGNKEIINTKTNEPVDLGGFVSNNITYKYIPLGVKVYNEIAYILAGAFDLSGVFKSGIIGSFPSPDWDILNSGGESTLLPVFSPFHNFKKAASSPGDSTDPFESVFFEFTKNVFIDMVIQGDFDRSANVIFTDSLKDTKIINSRFKNTDIYGVYVLADRRGNKDSNIYSDDDWDRIKLIQSNDFPINIESFKTEKGGSLKGGGYKYFFKYVTQEGNTTDILYESPLIPISNGNIGLSKGEISDKVTSFEVNNLDTSYRGIQVYFAHFDGFPVATTEYFKINYVYAYQGDSITIKHTGLESVTSVDVSEINIAFSPANTVKSIDTVNDRLALARITSALGEDDILLLEEISKEVTIWEGSTTITNSYSDPNMASKQLGYWPGEVYELAIIYQLTGKGLSSAFPITGMDNFYGQQDDLFFNQNQGNYPPFIVEEDGFSANGLFNHKGLFRTYNSKNIYSPECGEEGTRYVSFFYVNTSAIRNSLEVSKIVSGFFIVRRERIKNVLMQGMTIPTLKLPNKKMSISPRVDDKHIDFIGNFRYLLKHFPNDRPSLGLNAEYESLITDGDPIFNDDFSTVFVPQPTQILNTQTHERSWAVEGSVGQVVGNDDFGEDIDKDGNKTGRQHLAFYSCEIDINSPTTIGLLEGSTLSLEIQEMKQGESPVGNANFAVITDESNPPTSAPVNIIVKNSEKVSLFRAGFTFLEAENLKTTLLNSGSEITADKSFTSKTDRALGYLGVIKKDQGNLCLPYNVYNPRTSFINPLSCTARSPNSDLGDNIYRGSDFRPYSLITQSYSTYLGIEYNVEEVSSSDIPLFRYRGTTTDNKNDLANGDFIEDCPKDDYHRYVNIGHLTNLYRSSSGRWSQAEIRDLYKADSNNPYFAITKRFNLNNTIGGIGFLSDWISVFGGDGFISKFYKRTAYKAGVGVLSATSGDAGVFGIGINKELWEDFKTEEEPTTYFKDKGRNLLDVGQIIELVTYSNINADIRSTQFVSQEDTSSVGYDRDFYPNREYMMGDPRPDSINYNQGYSPNNNVIPYFKIDNNTNILSTEFPNRILLSEQNRSQEFYNSFRDLRGYNFRDYGLEYGPITKIITVNSILLSVHERGVLGIGIDDRTLLAEGSDIYVDTAKSLAPKAAILSDIVGSRHAESIIKTDTSIIGVDYNVDSVWMFVGDKVKVISEFAIKVLLRSFKKKIRDGKFLDPSDNTKYIARVYSTFNFIKHTLYISYVAEHPESGNQYNIGTVTYNTVLNKWMSRISEGNKFLMRIDSNSYSFGFSEVNKIWEEDALIDPNTEKYLRSELRGVQYNTEFEIIINDQPSYEKILENIIVLCNKRIPTTIVYKTSGEVNDSAINIWGAQAETDSVVQKLVTRNDSPRNSLRLGILDQNVYYKASKLYIEVGKVGYTLKEAGGKKIRDKHIKVRFIYKGTDELFVQAVISILSISYS